MLFLERIAELINQKGINRTKFLADLGLNKSAIYSWEMRGTVPGGETIAKIADYFGVTTDYLLGRTDTSLSIPSVATEAALNEEQKEIVRLYDQASPEMRAAMLGMLRAAEADRKARDGGPPGAGD